MKYLVDQDDLLEAVITAKHNAERMRKAGLAGGEARQLDLARRLVQVFANAGVFPGICLELGVSRSSDARTADRIRRSLALAPASASAQACTSSIASRR